MTDNSTPMPGTALPWAVEAFNEIHASVGEPDYSAFILGADGESILAQQISDQDAAYIVHTANNYPELVELVRSGISSLESAERETSWGDPLFGPSPSEELTDRLMAILAKART